MTNAHACVWLQKRYDFKTVSEIRDFMKGLGSYQTVPFLSPPRTSTFIIIIILIIIISFISFISYLFSYCLS
jgi:hypothetical protein